MRYVLIFMYFSFVILKEYMMLLRNYVGVIFILCLVFNIQSQELSDPSRLAHNKSSFSMSVFGGISLLGPSNDFKSNLTNAGFNNTLEGMFGTSTHPRTSRHGIIKIEGTYYFAKNKGVSVRVGKTDYIEVFGYKEPALLLIFESKIQEVALTYVIRSKDTKRDFYVGAVYLSHKVFNDHFLMQDPSDITNERIGIVVGIHEFLLNKKNYFIAFTGDFRWAAKSKIPVWNLSYQSLNAAIPTSKINLATFNLGISIGFRV